MCISNDLPLAYIAHGTALRRHWPLTKSTQQTQAHTSLDTWPSAFISPGLSCTSSHHETLAANWVACKLDTLSGQTMNVAWKLMVRTQHSEVILQRPSFLQSPECSKCSSSENVNLSLVAIVNMKWIYTHVRTRRCRRTRTHMCTHTHTHAHMHTRTLQSNCVQPHLHHFLHPSNKSVNVKRHTREQQNTNSMSSSQCSGLLNYVFAKLWYMHLQLQWGWF